jgi:hypothetical protein
VPFFDQRFGQVESDESGRAGDEDFHIESCLQHPVGLQSEDWDASVSVLNPGLFFDQKSERF